MRFVYQMEYLTWDSMRCGVGEVRINNGNKTLKMMGFIMKLKGTRQEPLYPFNPKTTTTLSLTYSENRTN